MDNFSQNNVIKVKTCYKSAVSTISDIMLRNKIRSFQKTSTVTTGITDCHKIIATCLKAHFKKLPLPLLTLIKTTFFMILIKT